MEESVIEERTQALEELSTVINDTQQWLEDVLSDLGWTQEHLLQKDEDLKQCPNDPNHRMPAAALEKHIKLCPYLKQGYAREELEDRLTGDDNDEAPADKIPLDDKTFFRIINSVRGINGSGPGSVVQRPLTVERATVELSLEQRQALYRYCVETAKARNQSTTIPEEQLMLMEDQKAREDTKGMTELERKAYERDMKRRRQSYRGKSTHTSKKSHYEVLRDVIGNQMELFSQMWNTGTPAPEGDNSSQKQEAREEENRVVRDRESRTQTVADVEDEQKKEDGELSDTNRSSKPDTKEGSTSSSKGKSHKHKKHHKHKSKKSKRHREGRSWSRDRSRNRSRSPIRSRDNSESRERSRPESRNYRDEKPRLSEMDVNPQPGTSEVVVKAEPQETPTDVSSLT